MDALSRRVAENLPAATSIISSPAGPVLRLREPAELGELVVDFLTAIRRAHPSINRRPHAPPPICMEALGLVTARGNIPAGKETAKVRSASRARSHAIPR